VTSRRCRSACRRTRGTVQRWGVLVGVCASTCHVFLLHMLQATTAAAVLTVYRCPCAAVWCAVRKGGARVPAGMQQTSKRRVSACLSSRLAYASPCLHIAACIVSCSCTPSMPEASAVFAICARPVLLCAGNQARHHSQEGECVCLTLGAASLFGFLPACAALCGTDCTSLGPWMF
jgi:hypothetical protein